VNDREKTDIGFIVIMKKNPGGEYGQADIF